MRGGLYKISSTHSGGLFLNPGLFLNTRRRKRLPVPQSAPPPTQKTLSLSPLTFLSHLSLSFSTMRTRNNKKKPKMYDYGMDYEGTVSDPMDGVIAAALRATGQEYARRAYKDMQTDRISVTDAGAGVSGE
jgi:hypothetical protein